MSKTSITTQNIFFGLKEETVKHNHKKGLDCVRKHLLLCARGFKQGQKVTCKRVTMVISTSSGLRFSC